MSETTKVNSHWNQAKIPAITVFTPIYNRRATIQRTIDSVDRQTFRDIEYILIDDGSTETCDDIIQTYMDSCDLPVMYIKKANGGVHTARNAGFRHARGELTVCIDSDDELLPDACKNFYAAWQSIPAECRKDYWQMKALCVDEAGTLVSQKFPQGINEMPGDQARKYFSFSEGERIGCRSAALMKKNLFPEPAGITFVTESIVWSAMERKYLSWGLNDVACIYHREGDDHLSDSLNKTQRKKTRQDCRNLYWNVTYMANHAEIYTPDFLSYLKKVIRSCQMAHILKKTDAEFLRDNPLEGAMNRFWKVLVWLPSWIFAAAYKRKYM